MEKNVKILQLIEDMYTHSQKINTNDHFYRYVQNEVFKNNIRFIL